jgi:hypothetical protein
MKQHKWHKEIKAWADGAEIEWRHFDNENDDEWYLAKNPKWDLNMYLFRIKPQPKTPKQSWDEELTRSYKETIIERLRTDNDFWIEVFTAYDNAKDNEIKPQPIPKGFPCNNSPTGIKEPQYLYVYCNGNEIMDFSKINHGKDNYIGKIKLEDEE